MNDNRDRRVELAIQLRSGGVVISRRLLPNTLIDLGLCEIFLGGGKAIRKDPRIQRSDSMHIY